jgi:hypothetical protein
MILRNIKINALLFFQLSKVDYLLGTSDFDAQL